MCLYAKSYGTQQETGQTVIHTGRFSASSPRRALSLLFSCLISAFSLRRPMISSTATWNKEVKARSKLVNYEFEANIQAADNIHTKTQMLHMNAHYISNISWIGFFRMWLKSKWILQQQSSREKKSFDSLLCWNRHSLLCWWGQEIT